MPVSQPDWTAATPWPNHPALQPPLPRVAKSSPTQAATRAPIVAAPAARRPVHALPAVPGAHPHVVSTPARASRPALAARPQPAVELAWPANYDDWMMDIVRRRALRLNSGARRRGVRGSVRAVELAHILERSVDASGRWLCALCHEIVTLDDLSFDHVVALADGGEHAAHNLVPAHRKCNEIKGSEKAQSRASALDRWLNEWAGVHKGATPAAAARHHARHAEGEVASL